MVKSHVDQRMSSENNKPCDTENQSSDDMESMGSGDHKSKLSDGIKSRSWIIAWSCCWINLFIFAVFRSAGVLYMALIQSLGCSYSDASWPISLAGGIASITCLPAGFMSHYFTVRSIVSIGIVVTSFGISICYFVSNIKLIIIFLGVIQGIGIGLVTGLLPAIISEYFGSQRAAACGLSYAGATIGAFIFPLIFQQLLNIFSLNGSLLIMGAIALNGILGAILLCPLKPPSSYRRIRKESTASESEELSGGCNYDLCSSGHQKEKKSPQSLDVILTVTDGLIRSDRNDDWTSGTEKMLMVDHDGDATHGYHVIPCGSREGEKLHQHSSTHPNADYPYASYSRLINGDDDYHRNEYRKHQHWNQNDETLVNFCNGNHDDDVQKRNEKGSSDGIKRNDLEYSTQSNKREMGYHDMNKKPTDTNSRRSSFTRKKSDQYEATSGSGSGKGEEDHHTTPDDDGSKGWIEKKKMRNPQDDCDTEIRDDASDDSLENDEKKGSSVGVTGDSSSLLNLVSEEKKKSDDSKRDSGCLLMQLEANDPNHQHLIQESKEEEERKSEKVTGDTHQNEMRKKELEMRGRKSGEEDKSHVASDDLKEKRRIGSSGGVLLKTSKDLMKKPESGGESHHQNQEKKNCQVLKSSHAGNEHQDKSHDASDSCSDNDEDDTTDGHKGEEEMNHGNSSRDLMIRESLYQSISSHVIKDSRLLMNPYFGLISLTYIAYIMSNVTLLIILPDFASNSGLGKNESVFLLSLFSVTDLLGRLLPGWISYYTRQIISNKSIYIFSITLMGVLFFLFPILISSSTGELMSSDTTDMTFGNFTLLEQLMETGHVTSDDDVMFNIRIILITLTLCCGFVSGCQMTLPPVIIAEYLGVENTAIAFGMSNFICGLLTFTRPIIIGVIKDQTKRYDDVFYLFGSFALISSLFWMVELIITRLRKFKSSVGVKGTKGLSDDE